MKLTTSHQFGWPVEKITGLLKAGEDLFPMEELPSVKMRKLVEEKRDGAKLCRKYEWCVHGQIPPIARKLFRPELLTFTETSVWDDDKCAFESRITTHYFKNLLTCKSTSAWRAAPDGGTVRHFESIIIVAIPLVGFIMEQAIAEHFRKNNDVSASLAMKGLEKRFGPPA